MFASLIFLTPYQEDCHFIWEVKYHRMKLLSVSEQNIKQFYIFYLLNFIWNIFAVHNFFEFSFYNICQCVVLQTSEEKEPQKLQKCCHNFMEKIFIFSTKSISMVFYQYLEKVWIWLPFVKVNWKFEKAENLLSFLSKILFFKWWSSFLLILIHFLGPFLMSIRLIYEYLV